MTFARFLEEEAKVEKETARLEEEEEMLVVGSASVRRRKRHRRSQRPRFQMKSYLASAF